MKLYHRNDHIVRFKNGDIWHFFPQKGKGIYLRCMKKNGIWRNPVELVANAHEHFSVSIDRHDHLHLIYQGYNGEIVYMEYNGNKWNKQLLHQYDTAEYMVQYPTVCALDQQVHAIFAVRTIPFNGIWSLHHYYNDAKGWNKCEITRYTDGKQTSPFYLDHDEKSIHIVYRSPHRGQYRLFYCHFDSARKRWSIPEPLSRNLTDCNMPSILVINNRLHFVWTSIRNSNLQVMYRNRPLISHFKAHLENETLLSYEESNCSDPQLLWADNQLWCMWYQNGDIHCCSSSDEGTTWNQAKPLGWSHIDSCYCIKYSSNYLEDQSRFKMPRIFARLDNGLEIITPEKSDGTFAEIQATNAEHQLSKPAMGKPHSEYPQPLQQANTLSSAIEQNSIDSISGAAQNASYTPSEETQLKDAAPTQTALHQEVHLSNPSDGGHVSQSTSSDGLIPASHGATSDDTGYVADKKQSKLYIQQEKKSGQKEANMKSDNDIQEDHRAHWKADQLSADQAMPNNAVNRLRDFLQDMNNVNGLKNRVQSLLNNNQSARDGTQHLRQLDILLKSWLQKAEEIQAANQDIMREIDALRRRCIENRRQWEIFLEEFEEIKELLEKKLRTGFLRKIIG